MSKYYVLYNPVSACGDGQQKARALENFKLDKETVFSDITQIDYSTFFSSLQDDDGIILCGGDGTLNRFINDADPFDVQHEILYFACGTGNDFLHDIGGELHGKPIGINAYITDLPRVTVKGKTYRFLNNVGFGIDGYCTQVGDEMRAAGKNNINYAGIAIKGMLGGFKTVNAKVTVDGGTREYRHVWLAPTMKGRFYGGGMMPTPAQDRMDAEKKVSVLVFRGLSKLKTLMVFPSIFQGEHIKHTKAATVLVGNTVTVCFNRPCTLQIDGETIRDVTEYSVTTDVAERTFAQTTSTR